MVDRRSVGLVALGALLPTLVFGAVLGWRALPPRTPPGPTAWVEMPEIWQGHGPWCLPTAAAVLATHQGYPVTPNELIRDVFVGPDGVAWTDLVLALDAHGIPASVVYPSVAALHELVAMGPVVVAQAVGDTGHAIVLERWDPDHGTWWVMDPANPGRDSIAVGTFEPSFERAGRTTLVIRPKR